MALRKKIIIGGDGHEIQADSIVVCAESFGGTDVVVRAGDRLRGDDPAVARFPAAFVADGASRDAIARARVALFGWEEAPPPVEADYQAAPRPIGPRGAMVAIRSSGPITTTRSARPDGRELGVEAGQRVTATDPRVKQDPDAFRPVCIPADIDFAGAVICEQRCEHDSAPDTGLPPTVVWPGQIVSRDHPLAVMNPHAFAAVPWTDLD